MVFLILGVSDSILPIAWVKSLPEENIGEKFQDSGLGKDFLLQKTIKDIPVTLKISASVLKKKILGAPGLLGWLSICLWLGS